MPIHKAIMTGLGAKEGSSSTKRYDWQTDEQKDLFGDVLSGYKDIKYKGPGEFTESQKADELEGFKATSFDQLRKLKDEGRLSLAGLEKLRNYGATAATQVNPDIEALRGLGDEAWQGYDAHLAETVRGARGKLQAADISSRRGAGTGGTALTRAIGANIGDYGRTVGQASARVAEESAYRRQQLAMQGRMQAGQLGLGATGQGLQGLQSAGQLELGQLGLTAQDLAQRRQLAEGSKQFGAGHELNIARYGAGRADARNLWNMQRSQDENRFGLDRLAGATGAATTRTFEDVVTKTEGSAGFGGALLSAASKVGGAYVGGMYGNPQLGMEIGGGLTDAFISSSGDYGGGGYGGGPNYGGAGSFLNAGIDAYGNRGGFNKTGYTPRVPPRASRFGGPSGRWNSGYDAGEFGNAPGHTFTPWQATTMQNDDPWGRGRNMREQRGFGRNWYDY